MLSLSKILEEASKDTSSEIKSRSLEASFSAQKKSVSSMKEALALQDTIEEIEKVFEQKRMKKLKEARVLKNQRELARYREVKMKGADDVDK